MRVVQFFPRFGGETKRRKVMFIVGRLKACLIMVALIKRTRWILPRTSYVPFYEISLFLVRTYIFVCRLTAKKNFQTAVINLVEVPARPFNARATFNFPQHFQQLRANEILATECVRFYVRSFN